MPLPDPKHIEKPLTVSSSDEPMEEMSMDDKLLFQLKRVVEDNLKNEQFSVEDLASEVAYSRSHLHRKLQLLKGQSISQFIRNIRLEHALDLLEKEVGTVSEIAYRVGFGSNTYFIKCFKEVYGYSPGEVRKRTKTEEVSTMIPPAVTKENVQKPTPLEALHPSSSETFILEVFEELIKYKPTLSKYLLIEEDESLDLRILAYQIIKAYPWLIGVELRRLFTGTIISNLESRVRQLNQTIRCLLSTLSFILVSDLVRIKQSTSITLKKSQKELISSAMCSLAPTSQLDMLKEIQKIFQERQAHSFIDSLDEIMDDQFFRELQDWLDIFQSDSGDLSLTEQAMLHEQTVIFLLKHCAFLAGYRLVNIGAIDVRKERFKDPSFEHSMFVMNSADSNFSLHFETLDTFTDSHAVLLMKSVKDPQSFLNLSPMIVDTRAIDMHRSHGSTLPRKDTFLLQNLTDGKLIYRSADADRLEELEGVDKQAYLKQYEELIKIIES